MSEPSSPELKRPTQHPELVKNYMGGKDNVGETTARELVARDLTLIRSRRDTAENKKIAEQNEKLALIDPLTGLYSRRGLFGDHTVKPPVIGQLEEIYSSSKRLHHNMALMMLDLDNFRDFNDNHQKGDKLLKQFALISREAVRDYDILGRYGGEEFLFIFPETNLEEAKRIAEKIQTTLKDKKIPITVSIGISSHNGQEPAFPSEFDFLGEADQALNLAKKTGKNRFQTYSDVVQTNLQKA
jgi:two-component system cell cycle response regulator